MEVCLFVVVRGKSKLTCVVFERNEGTSVVERSFHCMDREAIIGGLVRDADKSGVGSQLAHNDVAFRRLRISGRNLRQANSRGSDGWRKRSWSLGRRKWSLWRSASGMYTAVPVTGTPAEPTHTTYDRTRGRQVDFQTKRRRKSCAQD